MDQSIFFSQSVGSYNEDIVNLAKEEKLEDLVPCKVISRDNIQDGCYGFYNIGSDDITSNAGDASAGDYSRICKFVYKIHLFDCRMSVSHSSLMLGTENDNSIKTDLGHALMRNIFSCVLFGDSLKNIEGIATLSGRTKLAATEASSLTTGIALYQKVVEAKRKSEEYKKRLNGSYMLLLPHKFSHLLVDLYNEPHYITVRDVLLKDHNILARVFKGLEHPILYEPDPSIMFIPIMSEIGFRRFGDMEYEYIRASMQTAGVVHLRPKEVVEITMTS
ncbi:Hypothetical protein BCD_1089 (plasmid) [Borrelia crocidurae DOU]|uniref:Uncharacterized protein n=1 Tax=Borrelia crocidurae DOU TaxID=1293575 RepID=W5SJR2_9SPIR|nr:hypothetical protein [Borrelia crocidurae]AHH07155.1 Hypothetical protein BCD_1089 [Borrelia crocidurae DOU]